MRKSWRKRANYPQNFLRLLGESPLLIWVWLLFGNEKRPEKSGDFEPCRCGDDWKLPGYRGERGISPGLAAALWGFGAGSRWRRAFLETPCIWSTIDWSR